MNRAGLVITVGSNNFYRYFAAKFLRILFIFVHTPYIRQLIVILLNFLLGRKWKHPLRFDHYFTMHPAWVYLSNFYMYLCNIIVAWEILCLKIRIQNLELEIRKELISLCSNYQFGFLCDYHFCHSEKCMIKVQTPLIPFYLP